MLALVLLCANQHTKFEVRIFTDSNNMIESKLKNGSRDADHTHEGVVRDRKSGT